MLSWASLQRSAAMETRTGLRIDAQYKSLKQTCEMAQ